MNVISDTIDPASKEVRFRSPFKEDGADILQLVRDTGVLDVNSVYAYLLVGEHYSQTSVVAEVGDQLAGFISAYCPPSKPDTVFVWQVGVAEAGRGRGLATRMLYEILKRPACSHVRYLDTTVGPTNEASMALFRGFAAKLDTRCEEEELFASELFGDHESVDGEPHEPEILFRIGPFDTAAIRESAE
ncbi:diaminobutyrate acetyltransferase [Salinisphaera orenii]|uniref:diaminobutyrate acetyltransferase n=1 Tax=Salinisphaera orenii TaxID=856731 RepID=UPI001C82B0EA